MDEMIPTKYQLSQNYPNPFSDKTIIKYCVADKINVRLEVINSEKEIVKILVDDVKEPGTYEVEFDVRELSGDIYFYRMKAGDFVETKMMTLR